MFSGILDASHRWLRSPFLHFFLIGGLLFALGRSSQQPEMESVLVSAARLTTLEAEWRQREGRAPTGEEWRAIERRAQHEALLFHHALALRLDENDRTVRFRLVQNMRFLGEEGADEVLYERARELGLQHSDPVVRRYLISKMRLAAQLPKTPESPLSDQVLQDYLTEHSASWQVPERVDWVQVFSRREAGEGAAQELLQRLRREAPSSGAAVDLGDPFPLPTLQKSSSRAEIERSFGPDLAAAIDNLPTSSWQGPVPSPWGWHVVWIEARTSAYLPELDAVRGQVLAAIGEERRAERLRFFLEELEQRYSVRFDGTARARSTRQKAQTQEVS